MLNIYKNAPSVLLGKYALIDMAKFIVKEDKASKMIQEKKIKRREVQEDPILSRYLNLSQRRKQGLLKRNARRSVSEHV